MALISAQLDRDYVTMAIHGAQKHLQLALGVPCSMFVRYLGGRNVVVVAVELWQGCSTGGVVAGRNCKVRYNFGYWGPLFLGVSWHFLMGGRWAVQEDGKDITAFIRTG